jgi:hypothetical protein
MVSRRVLVVPVGVAGFFRLRVFVVTAIFVAVAVTRSLGFGQGHDTQPVTVDKFATFEGGRH